MVQTRKLMQTPLLRIKLNRLVCLQHTRIYHTSGLPSFGHKKSENNDNKYTFCIIVWTFKNIQITVNMTNAIT